MSKISPKFFLETLKQNGIEFYSGVPDSLLKPFCHYLDNHVSEEQHTIAANEGSALALGLGFHLATGKLPLIYLQNSGMGNLVNPILSLTDQDVYSIPGILMIGWRGEPGIPDEPQHVTQGKITLKLLELMNVPYKVFDNEMTEDSVEKELVNSIKLSIQENKINALVIKKGFFDDYQYLSEESNFSLSRERAINVILNESEESDIFVSTTGLASRELYDLREKFGHSHSKDFMVVGGMGHANQIALGIAMHQKKRRIICLDGDGAVIMHMGSLTSVGSSKQTNLLHVVLNNGAHDSVGGQKTSALDVNLKEIAKQCGYENVFSVAKEEDLLRDLKFISNLKGPIFLEVKVRKGWRKEIGRPATSPEENKNNFMSNLSKQNDHD